MGGQTTETIRIGARISFLILSQLALVGGTANGGPGQPPGEGVFGFREGGGRNKAVVRFDGTRASERSVKAGSLVVGLHMGNVGVC